MICATCGAELASDASDDKCPRCAGPVLLAVRYKLVSVLGRGANGITYRAERVGDGHAFAVKEIPLRTLESAKAMELFEREARVLRELSHDAIPRYEDDFVFGEGKNAGLYLVQELVSGKTLADEAASKRYELAEVFEIVAEVADILDYLHRRSPSVLHRDVKPKNVMRRDDGRLVLIDFGSVRDALSTGGGSTVAGTFGYMAPEQLGGNATPASDLYALGALALALLTRKEPDSLIGDDRRIDVRAHVDGTETSLALLEALLDPNPGNRPQRASDVARTARAIASGRAPTIARERSSERPRRDERAERKPARAAKTSKAPREGVYEQRKPQGRVVLGVSAALGLGVIAVFALMGYSSSHRTSVAARTELGVPELYARPIAVDVNGDGVEDMVLVTALDGGPRAHDDQEDTWGKENGRFEVFVQAIDGKDGRVLYSLPQGKPFTSLGTEGKSTAERVILVTRGTRLGIARVPVTGKATIAIHDLANGKEVTSLTFGPASGKACPNEGGPAGSPKGTFWFEGAGGTPGTVVDLERATASASGQSSCAPVETASVADVPKVDVTDRTTWAPRFSHEMKLRKGTGPWGGRDVVQSGALVVFLHDKKVPEKPETGPTITIDNGGGPGPGDRDNTKLDVVAFDLAAGTTRFERSLASLGFASEVVDHIEGTDLGPLLFFIGSRGLALLDPNRGDKAWSLPLPKGHRLSSYTLSKTRAYLHVFGPDPAIYGFLSKKLGSRVLVVDLAKGTYIRSVPAGSLEPDPPPKPLTYDPGSFKPVAGCSCTLGGGRAVDKPTWGSMTLEERRHALVTAGSAVRDAAAPFLDAGASSRVQLGMYVRSSIETNGKKRFTVAYSLDVDGDPFVLPHYTERRTTLAPPQSIEGDVSLGMACGGDTIVFVAERIATAWSLSKRDELWSVDLPVPRTDPKTTLGGSSALSCALGSIDDRGLVHVPSTSAAAPKEIVLRLADGTLETASTKPSGKDAGK